MLIAPMLAFRLKKRLNMHKVYHLTEEWLVLIGYLYKTFVQT